MLRPILQDFAAEVAAWVEEQSVNRTREAVLATFGPLGVTSSGDRRPAKGKRRGGGRRGRPAGRKTRAATTRGKRRGRPRKQADQASASSGS